MVIDPSYDDKVAMEMPTLGIFNFLVAYNFWDKKDTDSIKPEPSENIVFSHIESDRLMNKPSFVSTK